MSIEWHKFNENHWHLTEYGRQGPGLAMVRRARDSEGYFTNQWRAMAFSGPLRHKIVEKHGFDDVEEAKAWALAIYSMGDG